MRRIATMTGLAFLLSSCSSGEDPPEQASPDAQTTPQAVATSSDNSSEMPGKVAVPVASDSAVADHTAAQDASLQPRIPLLNATCGNGIEVHANEGGPVFIDGQEASLKRFNENYFEATHGATTISISFRPDNSLSLTFTGANRTNGICTLK